jgi:hypothetical protein
LQLSQIAKMRHPSTQSAPCNYDRGVRVYRGSAVLTWVAREVESSHLAVDPGKLLLLGGHCAPPAATVLSISEMTSQRDHADTRVLNFNGLG